MSAADPVRRLRSRDESDDVDRRIPEVDVENYSGFADAPLDHRIVTAGLASFVHDSDRETIGHVLMLDLDDVEDPAIAIEQAEDLDDLSIVLRSSPRSYHVVGLGVRSWDVATSQAVRSRADLDYVVEMMDKGRFIARSQPKIRRETGEIYKRSPEPVFVSPGEGPISRPHTRRIEQIANNVGREDVADRLVDAARGVEQIGETLSISEYETVTDELREVVAGDLDG